MSNQAIVVERTALESGDLAQVVLNNPKKRNALSGEVMRELTATLYDLSQDPAVRVIVLEGVGPAFSAGHDISEMVGRDEAFYNSLFGDCSKLMATLHAVPQPVIAKVDGVATAAGCQLVAACDLAVVSDRSSFATPGVRIGLFCSTPMVPLTRAIGRKRAMEMLLTAEPISSEVALRWGLVNKVVPPEELDGEVMELALRISQFSRDTIALGKRTFYRQADMTEEQAYGVASEAMVCNANMEDAQEGMDAFISKREPQWSDKPAVV